MLDLDSSPAGSFEYLLLKRAFDIAFSSTVLLLASPLMLTIAAAIRLTSRGPVLFRQERVGLSGDLFNMLKFRTMRVQNSGESDVRWTTTGDPRCTPIGRFLRKTSLDELPQFFNVLRGDMSVVGPRPERPYYVRKFRKDIARYHSRHRLKVGITGWAQVNGWRGDTSIHKRLEYDLYYIRHWSLAFDLQIILRTLLSGMVGKNAY
jgi:exopolysaccharide biosynthesis polyprenyl glycosylphosphotransferase